MEVVRRRAGAPAREGLEGPLLALITEACGVEEARAAGWRIEPSAGGTHIGVRNVRAGMLEQGWKLHVSSHEWSAEAVLCRVLPVLLAEDASFKVVSTVLELGLINKGKGGLAQIGKFVTVYPNSDAQAVRLAVALDEATRELGGPVVPSDRALAPDSLVHYRYGGFGRRLFQAPSGETMPVISAPGGELVPDRRSVGYRAPDWAVDPFVSAGVTTSPEESGGAIGGRYLLFNALHRSPEGAVYRALDVEGSRRCVLKKRRRDAGGAGRDARDHLCNEADVLSSLAPDERFPSVFGLVEQANGDLFLAMEHVEGQALVSSLIGLARQGRRASGERVVAWGRELAAMLGTIHEAGFVFRDLKPDNVIVAPDGRLRLLDFEFACKPETGGPLRGTRGYCSPQQLEGDPPAITDDVYSLGALLYAAVTHAFPPLAPDALDLLNRPVDLLNPAAGPGLVEVISRCLHPDPAARFASMADLDAALAQVGGGASVAPAPFGGEPFVESEEDVRRRYRELAKRLGDTLRREARRAPDEGGAAWLSKVPTVGVVPLRDISVGSAGTILALAELVGELGDSEHRAILAEGARWLTAAPFLAGQPLPGLYVGEAGVGAALLRTGQVLGDETLIEAATEKGSLISSLPHVSPDLFNGSAGRLRFHLMLFDETGDAEQLRYAVRAGEFLLEETEDVGDGGLRWPVPPGYGDPSVRAYLGYAHGAAGIADALLDLFEATQDERFLDPVRGAGRWLVRSAVPVLDDGSGLSWPPSVGGQLAGATWCHGAAGIGRFFLHAARLDVLPDASDIAAGAARAVARTGRSQGPTQCHGLAGSIEFLLDAYAETDDGAYLVEARSLTRLLEAFGREKDGLLFFPSDAPDEFVPDYMTGYAGVAVCLLRLAEPERLPHQLSRSGFRHRRSSYPAIVDSER